MKDAGRINMKDAGRINILKKLAEIADELDIKGLRKEANAVTKVMSQVAPTVQSQIEERKKAGQYTSSVADIQNTIDYAVKNKLTIRQMYDYALQTHRFDPIPGRLANDLITKYRNIYPDPDTAFVKPVKLTGTPSATPGGSQEIMDFPEWLRVK
jgi:hypothetical protein